MTATAAPLARRLADAALALRADALPVAIVDKVRVCLQDAIGCACETHDLPWSRQARALARPLAGDGATVIGEAGASAPGDAAFANAVMAHGLVREDMHAGSISHLGIVVVPTLLALAETRPASGADLVAAMVAGYEVGGALGRALLDADLARIHRPTGITGPLAAAAAGARLLGLDADAFVSALGLAANACAGFNQWAHTGGSEMFFHAGNAARNAVAAVELAAAGAFASPDALDGEAGLGAALGKRAALADVAPFADGYEIARVYHKAIPACNYAQTPALAALEIARDDGPDPNAIAAIEVRITDAALRYPGCDAHGPYRHALQGKMSIQYTVAVALASGALEEASYARLDDPLLAALVGRTTLVVDDALTAAYPARQGAEVVVTLRDGGRHAARLDDVLHATPARVTARCRAALATRFDDSRAAAVMDLVDVIERRPDAAALPRALRASIA
ncbi:MAG: MmgE/PrpD family protein [Gammaproteobacteria bacterium]